MPRCNLTLKQKCQIIELSGELTTELIAKKFHVHTSTVTRTLQKRNKILEQASRVNVNFKTVQTNQRGEEHDAMMINYIREKQEAKQPIRIEEICDKAVEFAASLGRHIKSKRGWWRRFKTRCNIVKSRLPRNRNNQSADSRGEKLGQKDRPNKKSPSKVASENYTFKVRQ